MNRIIEDRKLDEGATQVHVEAPKKTSSHFGSKGGKKKTRPRKDITCYFSKTVDTFRRIVHSS